MFEGLWNGKSVLLAALVAVSVLPLIAGQAGSADSQDRAGKALSAVATENTSPMIVATIMRPLDLATLSHADFGDSDTHN